MLSLLITILFGLLIAYFATQNTGSVSLSFLNYQIPNIPIYVVIISSLVVGLFMAWIVSFISDIGMGYALRGKDNKIKDYKKDTAELTKKIHQLELENTKLRAETNTPADDRAM